MTLFPLVFIAFVAISTMVKRREKKRVRAVSGEVQLDDIPVAVIIQDPPLLLPAPPKPKAIDPPTEPTMSQYYVMDLARKIWNRQNKAPRSDATEELEFRESFGVGMVVFMALWDVLVLTELLPAKGGVDHLLWTLMFMKGYAKTRTCCNQLGGIDTKTFKKWVWLFIFAIAELEATLVRKVLCMLLSSYFFLLSNSTFEDCLGEQVRWRHW